MALTTWRGTLAFPQMPLTDAPNTTADGTINADADWIAGVLRAPIDGSIDRVLVRTGATHTTNGDVQVAIETVDLTNGSPTGTLFGANTQSAAITVTAADTEIEATLTAAASVNAGDQFALTIRRVASGTLVTTFRLYTQWTGNNVVSYPYSVWFDGTSTVKSIRPPWFAIRYASDGRYFPATTFPFNAAAQATSFASNTNPNHRGLKFQVPSRVRLSGVIVLNDNDQDYNLKLYKYNALADTNNLQFTQLVDDDVRGSSALDFGSHYFPEQILEPNTTYRLVIAPSTTTAANLIYHFTVGSAATLDAFDGGSDFVQTTANNPTDGGAASEWTDTTTQRPHFTLLFDQVDQGTGGWAVGVL